MRKAIGIVLLAATGAAGAMLSCGGKIDTPSELDKEPRVSVYLYAGEYKGFQGASWLGVTGGRLYAAFPDSGVLVAFNSRAEVVADAVFYGVEKPFVVGVGTHEIVVADRADTAVTTSAYDIGGGDPMWAVVDTEWVEIGGLAIHEEGAIYVSDAKRNFVRAYDTEGNLMFGQDLADSGFGIGHVLSPRGIFVEEDTLYIAEAHPQKAQVQRISVNQPQTGIPFSPAKPYISTYVDTSGVEVPLIAPVDVCVNIIGQIFVLDEGHGLIIEYNRDGTTEAIVTAPTSGGPVPFHGGNSMGPYSNRIYALEPASGVVHRWDK